MAAVASSAVTLVSQYTAGDRFGNRVEEIKIFDVVLSAQGGTAADIPATLFGLVTLNWVQCVRSLVSTQLANVVTVVESGGAGFLVCDPNNATDATRSNPTNYTGTVRVRMGGV